MKQTIVLGICGGIAAYKMAELASRLTKEGYQVEVLMTENATKFIAPLTFETLTGNKCMVDTFDRNFEWDVKHISLAKRAEVCLIAPATANVCAKLAHGLADDMLTTTVLAMRCPVLVAPSMNTAMYENAITQRNFATLREAGMTLIEAESGVLACRDVGKGRLPRVEVLYEHLMIALSDKDLAGKKVLVTAGATREPIDPVRYLTNRSTGKMGYAIAKAAVRRGAEVVLVSGKTALAPVLGATLIEVETAAEMYDAVMAQSDADIIIKAAAVADFTPAAVADNKLKKKDGEELTLPLARTKDILQALGAQKRPGQKLCGFSMETVDLVENSAKKLEKKQLDLVAANNVKVEGAGFGVDTNVVTLITKDGVRELPKMTKWEVANVLLDALNT